MSPRSRTLSIVIIATVVVGVAAVAVARTRSPSDEPGGARAAQPNLLVIMTDDQTLESVRTMTIVNQQLANEGTQFDNYYVSFPNCCPSRATYLSGQYAHNNGVEDNVPPMGGSKNFSGTESLPVWLQRGGYYTVSVGKYLNGWGSDGEIAPPPGWNRWFGLIDPSTYNYFNYSVSVDGIERTYGARPEDYQTDVLGGEVVQTIKDRAGQTQPWFISFTPLAPHAEKPETQNGEPNQGNFRWAFPKAAPRHERSVRGVSAPRLPSFNVDNQSKPEEMKEKEEINPGLEKLIDEGYRYELESLKAVDEWVGKTIEALRQTNQLDNTVIVFTSDNGYYHGEHRLSFQKFYLYEPAVRVPLIIRGGSFPKGKRVPQMAANVDLAPTLLAAAGLPPNESTDGIDLAKLLKDEKTYSDRAILLENKTNSGHETKGIHTDRYVYLEHETREVELYDLRADPNQLKNLSDDPASTSLKNRLANRLAKLKTCARNTCRDA